MPTISMTTFRERPAVSIENDLLQCVVLLGGGHIACLRHRQNNVNVLWEPKWPSIDPSASQKIDPAVYGDGPETALLATIAGLNLCVDVFGAHSPGEGESGASIHGEAGMVTWVVDNTEDTDNCSTLRMCVGLSHSRMRIERDFILREGSHCIDVVERMINGVGFERATGRAQHMTLGEGFLKDGVVWSCNADRGFTMDNDAPSKPGSFASLAAFEYPHIPLNEGGYADWTRFPREEGAGNICTLRVNPTARLGHFTALNPVLGLAVAAQWERDAFPWIATWEENRSRWGLPWNGCELTRGIEFSSYALPTSRQDNVARGTLFDTPCFEWLDAYEQTSTSFTLAVTPMNGVEAPAIADILPAVRPTRHPSATVPEPAFI